jgi:hypothetical protein
MRRRAHDGGGGGRSAEPRPAHHSLFGERSPRPVNGAGNHYAHAASGGIELRMVSIFPPALRPNMVPRS